MKFSRLEIGNWRLEIRFIEFFIISLLVVILCFSTSLCSAQVDDLTPRAPDSSEEYEKNIPWPVDLEEISHFPRFKKETTRIREDTSLYFDSRLRLLVGSAINAKKSKIGDYFRAHVVEDFYVPTNPPQILVPKGSWVHGKVSSIKRPNIFSMSAKIDLHLYQLVTPFGEVITLDTEVDVKRGVVNKEGFLVPLITSKKKTTKSTEDSTGGRQINTVSITDFDTQAIEKLMDGTLIALFLEEDTTMLAKGQELQLLLEKNVTFK